MWVQRVLLSTLIVGGCVAEEGELCAPESRGDDDDDNDAAELCQAEDEQGEAVDRTGEACEEEWADNPCRPNGAGVQYCDRELPDQPLAWGACVDPEEATCNLGDVINTESCADGVCEPCSIECILIDGVPHWEDHNAAIGKCETPLVLSFDGAPIQMEPAPAATFDISDAGRCLTTDWPTAVTPWLAMDRDGDGAIESGRELFGSGTRLESGRRAPNGFTALTELDDNGDGRIDATDAAFKDLVLWADEDADKRSTWFELQPLSARGILSIELDYEIDRQCDDRGNCAVERASFKFIDRGGEVRDGEVVDMHLSCQ